VLYFDATRKLLLPVQGDAFTAWLADALSMNRAERVFSFVQAAVETEGLSERATGIQPATYWASTGAACYLSNGPGRMVRVTAAGVDVVDNGTDGVLFPYGSTLAPWGLTDPADPFEACSLFREYELRRAAWPPSCSSCGRACCPPTKRRNHRLQRPAR
jgi:hypothetical protein